MAVWSCKIGEVDRDKLPDGSDAPLREAVANAYRALTGEEPSALFSGWGGEFDELERTVIEEQRARTA